MIEFNFTLDTGDKTFRYSAEIHTDRVAVLGKSGSGKTTLAKAISGLLKPNSGLIRVNDRIFFDSKKNINLPPWKRGIGFMFQNHRLFPFMSVRKNLLFARTFGRKNQLSFNEVVNFLDIEPLLHRMPAQLSGGEAQRVALGRAMLGAEQLLIFDEPLSSLDQNLRLSLQSYIEKVQNFTGLPYFYITHQKEEALRLTDECLLISEGACVSCGKTSDLL